MKYIPPKRILSGIMTYIPGLSGIILSRGTGGTSSARYCYSVWMRHLAMKLESGIDGIPATVAELGPGDSLGIGLSALLSGAEKYSAMDVAPYAGSERTIKIFDELIALFLKKEAIPGDDEFADIWPRPARREFPGDVLTDKQLNSSLSRDRLGAVREDISNLDNSRGLFVKYHAPWDRTDIIERESVDMVFSQAVLEHVDDLDHTYEALFKWLKPGGVMSHQVDFSAHVFSGTWNGHWTFSDLAWKIMRGKMYYALNREPLSKHLQLLDKHGFEVVRLVKIDGENKISRNELAPRFRNITDEDIKTRGAYILSRKPG